MFLTCQSTYADQQHTRRPSCRLSQLSGFTTPPSLARRVFPQFLASPDSGRPCSSHPPLPMAPVTMRYWVVPAVPDRDATLLFLFVLCHVVRDQARQNESVGELVCLHGSHYLPSLTPIRRRPPTRAAPVDLYGRVPTSWAEPLNPNVQSGSLTVDPPILIYNLPSLRRSLLVVSLSLLLQWSAYNFNNILLFSLLQGNARRISDKPCLRAGECALCYGTEACL